nr:hypothetical protein [Pectinatus frisingensis]
MAEAFGKVMGLNVFECFSAGTDKRDYINQDAVRFHAGSKTSRCSDNANYVAHTVTGTTEKFFCSFFQIRSHHYKTYSRSY